MKSLQRTHEIHSEENSGCPAAPPENLALVGIKRGSEMLKHFYAGAPVDNVRRFLGIHGRIFCVETDHPDDPGRQRGDVHDQVIGYLCLYGLRLSFLVQNDEFADRRNRSNACRYGNWQATR